VQRERTLTKGTWKKTDRQGGRGPKETLCWAKFDLYWSVKRPPRRVKRRGRHRVGQGARMRERDHLESVLLGRKKGSLDHEDKKQGSSWSIREMTDKRKR